MSELIKTSLKKGKALTGGKSRAMWWLDAEQGAALQVSIGNLEKQQESRNRQWLRYAKLYSNQYLTNLYDSARAREAFDDAYIAWNCVRVNCETAESRLMRNRVRVVCETAGGDWRQQRQASATSQFLLGDQKRAGFAQEMRRVFQHACVFGTGIMRTFIEDGKVACEAVPPWQMLFDDNESTYGDPRTAARKTPIHREVVADWFPEHRVKLLDELPGWSPDGRGDGSDMLLVYEGHHVGARGTGGRRVLTVKGWDNSLLEEAYDKPWLPYVPLRWQPKLVGYWGSGIAETLIGSQVAINDLTDRIDRVSHLLSGPKTYVSMENDLNPDDVTNALCPVIRCEGVPTVVNYPAIPAELLQLREDEWRMSFQLTGLSEMDATGTKPAGLESGEAQRVYHDITSARHVVTGEDIEDYHVTLSERWLDLAYDCYGDRNYSVTYKDPDGRVMRDIDWKKIKLQRGSVVIGRFPVSGLPSTPSGKQDRLREWFQDGLIDKATFMQLADVPDLDTFRTMETAGIDDIKATIEAIIDDGKYDPPMEYQSLKMGIPLVNAAWLRFRRFGLPAKRQEMLLRWMDEANFIVNPQAAAAMPTLPPTVDPNMLSLEAPPVQPTPQLAAPTLPGSPEGAPPGPPLPGMVPPPMEAPQPVV